MSSETPNSQILHQAERARLLLEKKNTRYRLSLEQKNASLEAELAQAYGRIDSLEVDFELQLRDKDIIILELQTKLNTTDRPALRTALPTNIDSLTPSSSINQAATSSVPRSSISMALVGANRRPRIDPDHKYDELFAPLPADPNLTSNESKVSHKRKRLNSAVGDVTKP